MYWNGEKQIRWDLEHPVHDTNGVRVVVDKVVDKDVKTRRTS